MRNLIAISGKMGHGKDLVGKIIQLLNIYSQRSKIDLPFSWELTSDISFVLEFLKPEHENKTSKYLYEQGLGLGKRVTTDYQVKKFADKLKDIVCLLVGCTRDQLEYRKFKEKELPEEWWYWHMKLDGGYGTIMLDYLSTSKEELNKYEGLTLIKLTPRLLLQLLGTDCGRQIIHPNIWVNSLFADYKQQVGYAPGYYFGICRKCKKKFTGDKRAVRCEECSIVYPNWIITDLRFPNEAEAVKSRGGLLIRVKRNAITFPGEIHESETALDNYQEFDYTIMNDGSIEDLIIKVKEILIKEGIIPCSTQKNV